MLNVQISFDKRRFGFAWRLYSYVKALERCFTQWMDTLGKALHTTSSYIL